MNYLAKPHRECRIQFYFDSRSVCDLKTTATVIFYVMIVAVTMIVFRKTALILLEIAFLALVCKSLNDSQNIRKKDYKTERTHLNEDGFHFRLPIHQNCLKPGMH